MIQWDKLIQVLRAHIYLRRCTRVGHRAQLKGKAIVLIQGGTIRLGARVRIRGTHVPVELAAIGGELTIGDQTFINSGVSICATNQVIIGRNCAIGNFTLIMDNDFHEIGALTKAPKGQPVIIKDNVWLAARVTVLKGVTIGEGAVVAAGAVVTRDVAPYTLVGGVPARLIRRITSQEVT